MAKTENKITGRDTVLESSLRCRDEGRGMKFRKPKSGNDQIRERKDLSLKPINEVRFKLKLF